MKDKTMQLKYHESNAVMPESTINAAQPSALGRSLMAFLTCLAKNGEIRPSHSYKNNFRTDLF